MEIWVKYMENGAEWLKKIHFCQQKGQTVEEFKKNAYDEIHILDRSGCEILEVIEYK